jgi:hypothetical protein
MRALIGALEAYLGVIIVHSEAKVRSWGDSVAMEGHPGSMVNTNLEYWRLPLSCKAQLPILE